MPSTTPCLSLPYPDPTDPPNVQADMQALAEAVDTATCGAVSGAVPLGTILPFYGADSDVPSDFLVCDGRSFIGSSYPALETRLGGTTMPDLRSQFLRGQGGAFPTLGQQGGFNDSIVVIHSHTLDGHSHPMPHTHNGQTSFGTGEHQHTPPVGSATHFVVQNAGQSGTGGVEVISGTAASSGATNVVATEGGTHRHGIDNETGNTGLNSSGTANATGQSGVNRNLPPFFNVLYIMKAV